MGKFSEAEVEQLKGNENVEYVTEREIYFTPAFKQLAWKEKQSGKKLPVIFRENGIDPKVLGDKRIENFSRRLRETARNNRDFADGRRDALHPKGNGKALSTEEKIQQLEHELAYTRQEVEFLKKLQMANTEARKEWESKHRPK